MARIRTIKPEFWQDEKLAPLEPVHRLVFLGLISQADDAGRLVDNARLIDGLLFPATNHSSRESIETLARIGRVVRYKSKSGQALIQISNWGRHQRVVNPSMYVLPGPSPEDIEAQEIAESSLEPNESLNRTEIDPKLPTYYQRPTTNDLLPIKKKGKKSIQLPLPETWTPNESHQQKAQDYGVDVAAEAEAFKDHHLARDNRFVDWDRAFHTWLRNTQKFGPNSIHRKDGNDRKPSGRYDHLG